jgi:hypothetical protein
LSTSFKKARNVSSARGIPIQFTSPVKETERPWLARKAERSKTTSPNLLTGDSEKFPGAAFSNAAAYPCGLCKGGFAPLPSPPFLSPRASFETSTLYIIIINSKYCGMLRLLCCGDAALVPFRAVLQKTADANDAPHALSRAEKSPKSNHSRTSYSPVSPIIPVDTQKQGGTSNQMIFANAPLRLSNPGGSNRLEDSIPICRLSAVNCKPIFLRPVFTTT